MARARFRRRTEEVDLAYWALFEKRVREQIKKNAIPIPETPDELWDLVKELFDVEIVREVHPDCVDKGHCSPFDAFCSAFFADNPVDVWQGARGFSGKTFQEATLCITEECVLAIRISLLGGSLEQATLAHDYTQDLWQRPGAPRRLLLTDPARRVTRLRNGGGERVLTASMRSVRGPHPTKIRLDEIDETTLAIVDAALGQPMAKGVRGEEGYVASHTLLSGTHHNAVGTMTEVKKRIALLPGWVLWKWCWRESIRRPSTEYVTGDAQPMALDDPSYAVMIGWLDPAEVAAAKERVPAVMWAVEYEGEEPIAEGRAFYEGVVDSVFLEELGVYEGKVDEHIEIEEPVVGGQYATGVDWAKTQDYTIVVTIRYDVIPWRVVAFSRQQRRPYPQMVANAEARLERFPGGGYHDSRGVGAALADDITNPDLEGFDTGKRGEDDPMNDYVVDIEHGRIVWPKIESARLSHLTATVDDLWGRGHRPDEMVAADLAALYARERTDAGDGPETGARPAPGSASSERERRDYEDERDSRDDGDGYPDDF